MLRTRDTITIINALKLCKELIHEKPIIVLTTNSETLSVERIDYVIDQLTDHMIEHGLDETK